MGGKTFYEEISYPRDPGQNVCYCPYICKQLFWSYYRACNEASFFEKNWEFSKDLDY